MGLDGLEPSTLMARRKRSLESSARMHTTPPVMVQEVNPLDDHPGLTPLEHRRIKRIAGKGKPGKAKVDVKVKVEAGGN